jgi:hypothetical protein
MNEGEFRAALLKKIDLNNRLQALNLVKDKQSLKEKLRISLHLESVPPRLLKS